MKKIPGFTVGQQDYRYETSQEGTAVFMPLYRDLTKYSRLIECDLLIAWIKLLNIIWIEKIKKLPTIQCRWSMINQESEVSEMKLSEKPQLNAYIFLFFVVLCLCDKTNVCDFSNIGTINRHRTP